VLLILRVHWPYLQQPSEQSVDEGYLIAIGQRMLHGRMLPFVDGTAHSGPLFLLSGALIAAFDEFGWLPVRVAAVLCFAALSALTFACGRVAGRPLAGAIAAASIPFYATLRMQPYDGIAYNAELPGMVFALSSLYAALRALKDTERPPALGWLVAAGLLTSCGALSKQVSTLLVLPVAAYVLLTLRARDGLSRRARVRLSLVYLSAALLPALLLLGYLGAAGALPDAYYYLVEYNRGPYMFPFREVPLRRVYADWVGARPFELALCVMGVSWGVAQLVAARASEQSWLRALYRSRFDLTVALMALGGLVAARASRRDFDHYYLQVIPGFALLIGSLIERATESTVAPRSTRLTVLYRVLLLAPLCLIGEVAWANKEPRLTAWSSQHMHLTDLTTAAQEPPVCQFIRAHSAPSDYLFVWGFRAQLYVSCARLPASRFVFTTFVAGHVPLSNDPVEVEDTLAVPGSRELLIAELEATKPPVIVDSARTLAMRSLRRYQTLFQYVDQHYRFAGVVGDDEVWLRKEQAQALRSQLHR
jgi:hypothetical protein